MATIQQLYSILEQYVDFHAIWHVMNRTNSIRNRQPTRHIGRHLKNLSHNQVISGCDFGINQKNDLCGLTVMAFFCIFLIEILYLFTFVFEISEAYNRT